MRLNYLPAFRQTTDVSVQLEALDILADLLSRFGSLLVNYHANILEALLPQLCSPRLAVRKRSVAEIFCVTGLPLNGMRQARGCEPILAVMFCNLEEVFKDNEGLTVCLDNLNMATIYDEYI